jgi:tRNA (cytidine/uridine-2'-O-)-methyltransferase
MKYEPRLHVVLHQPEIPQNSGNVARTCVAAGAKLWLVRPLGFQLNDHYLRRAGLDYWEHLEWEVADSWDELQGRLTMDTALFFSKAALRRYTDVAYQPGEVLVFGSESQGLPAALLPPDKNRCLSIPTRPQVRSLNLSNSVAVVVFEASRQWDAHA